MRNLELLAPARNKDIGIAAIDCGADAVYIAGPAFGARHAAGNSLEDIAELCRYAHRFGARIMLTVNTIVSDDEIDKAHRLMTDAQDAGVDAFIVQDTALMSLPDIHVPIHASTQCAIRNKETARWYESLGCGRIVLERQLPLTAVREIAESVDCEIECFVHGALCVCYSGQCYLSEHIDGRSANRGNCMQACRSLYDLVDDNGRIIVKDKALLSLKDLNLSERIGELADAGVDSFKIEGRLKGISYVKNIVRAYSIALDKIVASSGGKYRRASWGRISGGFQPETDKTFNRGYTQLYIDGTKGKWASMDSAKSIGEAIGAVESIRDIGHSNIEIRISLHNSGIRLANGDGFAFIRGRETVGFRGDVCNGNVIRCRAVPGLNRGVTLLRNMSAEFERRIETGKCIREISVSVSLCIRREGGEDYVFTATADSQDGRTASGTWQTAAQEAQQRDKMISTITAQLGKRHLHYSMSLEKLDIQTDGVPFVPASFLNGIRRQLAEAIDAMPVNALPINSGKADETFRIQGALTYKSNICNTAARKLALSRGAAKADDAYEISHVEGAELMRSKYCIKYELGMCPVHQRARQTGPLHLLNNGRRLDLAFDCAACEMTVSAGK